MRKKLGIALLVVLVLLVAAALIVPQLIDVNKYHDQIVAQLQEKLGRQVSLGNMGLSLFPPSFKVENAVISEDSRLKTEHPFADVHKLSVSVEFWPLLSKNVKVKSLYLDRPLIELVKDAQGTWNFASLGSASAKPSPKEPADKSSAQLSFANLEISDGQVAITDLQKHESRAVYDHIDLLISGFAPDKQFTLKAEVHLPGEGKQVLSLSGDAGPISQSDMLQTRFDGQLKLDQVSISGVQKFLNLPALAGTEALISGDAKIKNADGKLASSGNLRMENTRIRNVNVGYPIALDYDLTDDLKNEELLVRKGELKLGPTPITLAGTLNLKPTPAQADLKVTASNASIEEMARLASAFGVAFGEGMEVKGRVDANVQARGPLDKAVLNGHVSARDLFISGKELPQPVKISAIELTMTPDAIRSNDFAASTGSTNVNMNFALSQYATNNSIISAGVKAPNARIAELLNIGKAAGVSALDGISGDGALSLDVHAQGPTKNMSALAFSGSGKIQEAKLQLPSLTKPVMINNSDIAFSENSIALDKVSAAVGGTNATGSLTLKNFAEPQVKFTLTADKINVAELQQLTATPPPAKHASTKDFWRIVPDASAETGPASADGPSIVNKMTGSGTLNVGTLTYDDLVLNNVHTDVAMDRGLIKLNPLTADVYGGKETGNITLDLRPTQPVYTVNLKTDKVDANKLVSSVSSIKQTLYGMLASNVNASFSSTSADSIARSLNGKVDMNLTQGKLMHVDLMRELATVGKFLGSQQGASQGFTNLLQLSGNFDVKNGVATTNNLKALVDGGTLSAAGLVNLADQSLNMHVTAVLNKAMSQQVGGSQVGGFMNTALANSQGELVLPVIVTGNFQHLQFAPDVQQIAQMKLQNLLPTSKDPGQLTSGILGQLLGGKGQNGTASGQQPGQQKGGVQGVLDALGGKKPADNKTAGPTPTPQPQNQNPLGDILGQFGKKKKPSPTPTPVPK